MTEDPAGFTLDDILRRKSEARIERARNLAIGQKIAIVERMRTEMTPFAAIRERNRQRRMAQRAAKPPAGQDAAR